MGEGDCHIGNSLIVGQGATGFSYEELGTGLKDGEVLIKDRLGIGTTNPGEKLTVAGTIESTTGGVKFPDGTIQTTAAGGFGVWNDRNKDGVADTVSAGVQYTAETDGFIIAGGGTANPATIETPVGTERYREPYQFWSGAAQWLHIGATVPVRKGDTWRAVNFATVHWLPVGD